MGKRLLIDLDILRRGSPGEQSDNLRIDGIYGTHPDLSGRKSIREQAVFRYSCRRCLDAPCIAACPADALDRDGQNMIRRSTLLCVACKSCVVICPFGTMMNDFFEHNRTPGNYLDLDDPDDILRLIEESPPGSVVWIDIDEDPGKDIHRLNDLVLIREKEWQQIKPVKDG